MKKIKVSIRTNQIGHYFLYVKKYHLNLKGKEYCTDDQVVRCLTKTELAKKFVLKSFQIKKFKHITNLSKYDFNSVSMQIEYAAMKLEEKDQILSRFLLKYKVIATKYYDNDIEEEDI